LESGCEEIIAGSRFDFASAGVIVFILCAVDGL
jgi:hypothetical protein